MSCWSARTRETAAPSGVQLRGAGAVCAAPGAGLPGGPPQPGPQVRRATPAPGFQVCAGSSRPRPRVPALHSHCWLSKFWDQKKKEGFPTLLVSEAISPKAAFETSVVRAAAGAALARGSRSLRRPCLHPEASHFSAFPGGEAPPGLMSDGVPATLLTGSGRFPRCVPPAELSQVRVHQRQSCMSAPPRSLPCLWLPVPLHTRAQTEAGAGRLLTPTDTRAWAAVWLGRPLLSSRNSCSFQQESWLPWRAENTLAQPEMWL